MRINTNVVVIFIFIWLLMHTTCTFESGAHDMHVSDKPWTAPVSWVSTNTVMDADGVCWNVYKECEPGTTCAYKLHVEEVTCP